MITKCKVNFFIYIFYYNHLESWTNLGVGVLTLQVHPAPPYSRSAPPVQDFSSSTSTIYGSRMKQWRRLWDSTSDSYKILRANHLRSKIRSLPKAEIGKTITPLKFAQNALHFYMMLRKKANFKWTIDFKDIFEYLKKTLVIPLVLTQPILGKHYTYLW